MRSTSSLVSRAMLHARDRHIVSRDPLLTTPIKRTVSREKHSIFGLEDVARRLCRLRPLFECNLPYDFYLIQSRLRHLH